MADAPDYLRVIGTTALNGAVTAAWVAAGELSAGKRRVVRTAATVAGIAVGWATLAPQERPFTWTRENGFELVKDAEQEKEEWVPEQENGRSMALALGMVGVGVGAAVGGRKLEKRWLAGLQRAGHPHPYRGLAWRMALLNAAGSLPASLFEMQRVKDRAKARAQR